MDPVDAAVCKEDEERILENSISPEWRFARKVVKLGISSDLKDEERRSENRDDWYSGQALLDLLGHLVLEVSRVLEHSLVEYSVIKNEASAKVH